MNQIILMKTVTHFKYCFLLFPVKMGKFSFRCFFYFYLKVNLLLNVLLCCCVVVLLCYLKVNLLLNVLLCWLGFLYSERVFLFVQGVIYQAIQQLFQSASAPNDTGGFEFSISYMEIYNENCRDLLRPVCVANHTPLPIFTDGFEFNCILFLIYICCLCSQTIHYSIYVVRWFSALPLFS